MNEITLFELAGALGAGILTTEEYNSMLKFWLAGFNASNAALKEGQ